MRRVISLFTFFISLTLASFLPVKVFAETKAITVKELATEEAAWQTVIDGSPICRPLATTYGFVVVNDGRMLTACSERGVILWQKPIKGRPGPNYTVARGDFLYVVTAENKLSLINPSGIILWSTPVPFSQITQAPIAGYDGRMFVQGKNNIACYGMNGNLKWSINTPAMANLPLYVFNDGSLILIQSIGNKGKRISPFGKEVEEITFPAKVKNAVSCNQGIFFVLENGSSLLYTIKDGKMDLDWEMTEAMARFSTSGGLPASIDVKASGNMVAVSVPYGSNGTLVTLVDTKNHAVENRLTIENAQVDNTKGFIELENDNIIIAGKTKAASYSYNGDIIWAANLPKASTWQYAFYTKSGYLNFTTGDNWVIKSYRVYQRPLSKENEIEELPLNTSYDSFYEDQPVKFSYLPERAFSKEDYKEIIKTIKAGNYSEAEQKWLPMLKAETSSMAEFYSSNNSTRPSDTSIFKTDISYQEELFNIIALLGSNEFNHDIAILMHNVTDPQLLDILVRTAAAIGYDDDGALLREIEYIVAKKTYPKDKVLLKDCADATYTICKTMGRPALYAYGKRILSYMLFPQFEKAIQSYARKKLTDIMKLGI
ncbi:MAG: PQQ-binding-like beta-propeller repeat protein [Treponema sp.]|nr:PQQ-binding-like beta-propeller repeat protein [Treponema sp.]